MIDIDLLTFWTILVVKNEQNLSKIVVIGQQVLG